MRIPFKYVVLFAAAGFTVSCKRDNFAPPGSVLSGHVVYKGEAIQVEKNQVPFQIYQYGLGKVAPIGGAFSQDGSYSSTLFDGNYKIIVPNGQGPFMWKQTAGGNPDTVNVTLKGNQTLDLEVTPFWMIRNATLAASAGKVTGTCKLEKIITDANAKDIEKIGLYINSEQFVSENGDDNIGKQEIAAAAITDINNISFSVTIPSITPAQNYVYARIGLKLANVEDLVFSPLQKISF